MKTRKVICVLIACVLVLASAYPAMAYDTEYIETFYGVGIFLDGRRISYTYPNGKKAEAFISSGVTYLPVRAVAESMGLGVEWDGNTRTVSLTSGASEPIGYTPVLTKEIREKISKKFESYIGQEVTADTLWKDAISIWTDYQEAVFEDVYFIDAYQDEEGIHYVATIPEYVDQMLEESDIEVLDILEDIYGEVETLTKGVCEICQIFGYDDLAVYMHLLRSSDTSELVADFLNGYLLKQSYYRHTINVPAGYGITILLDGQEVVYTYPNGQKAEAFVSDGVTYLPVRAVADALGLDVQWFETIRCVYLSSQ